MAPALQREHLIHPKSENSITDAANFTLRIPSRAELSTFDMYGRA